MLKENNGQSKTLFRGLSILTVCASSGRALNLVEIAELTQLAPSTVHRLLTTLQALDFLSVDPETGRWTIGVAGFRMGNAFVQSRDYTTQIRPLMIELSEETGETVNLAILSGARALFVSQIESRNMMRMVAPLGSVTPLHASGAGKALLAGLSDEERNLLIDSLDYLKFTTKTHRGLRTLKREIAEVLMLGCAFDREEHVAGMQCVAAPVFNEVGHPICTLSVSGPLVRISEQVLRKHGEAVRAMGQRATELIGGQPPRHWIAYA
jgi:IclR family acetate operon transcriptional repressor|tara:strand:+ start:14239 stop:15036 length:798 start_codon:yes stop_codon:yes gene_type:complete